MQGGKPWLGDVEMTSPDLGQNSTFGDIVAQGDASFETSIWCLPMLYQFLRRVIGKGGACFRPEIHWQGISWDELAGDPERNMA